MCLYKGLIGAVSVIAMQVSATAAEAEKNSNDSFMLEEIVVTALKRKQSLIDVPASVSVIDSAFLQDNSVSRMGDMMNVLPNVTINVGTGIRGTRLTIRGISSNTDNPGIPQSVGVFVDGVYMARPVTINSNIFDIERIELVRGPQGTLYGKNTIAGALNYVGRLPGKELAVEAMASYGNYNAVTLAGAIDIPVIEDKFAVRLSGSFQDRDGFTTNLVTGEDINSIKEHSFRMVADFTPSEFVEFILRADYAKTVANSGAPDILDNGGNFIFAPFPAPVDASPFDRTVSIDTTPLNDRKVYGGSLEVNANMGAGTLTSITAYREYSWVNVNEADYTPLNIVSSGIAEEYNFFSQELRYDGVVGDDVHYIVGAYYSVDNMDVVATNFIGGVLTGAPFDIPVEINANVQNKGYSLFGEVTYDLSDRLSATAGVRYSDEDQTVVHRSDFFPGLQTGRPGRTFVRSDNELTYSANARYEVDENMSVYGTFSHGFKAGGFNVFQLSSVEFPEDGGQEFNPEFVDNFELGMKSFLLDRRVRLNASVFYLNYKDLQVQQLINNGTLFTTSNAAKATSKGLELELQALLAEGLTFNGSYGYQDATYKDFQNANTAGDDFSGNRLIQAPKHTLYGSLKYETEIVEGYKISGSVGVSHRSSIFFSPVNDDVRADGSNTLVNARVALSDGDDLWSLAFFVRNLGNKTYPVSIFNGFVFIGQRLIGLGAPETYGAEVRLKF